MRVLCLVTLVILVHAGNDAEGNVAAAAAEGAGAGPTSSDEGSAAAGAATGWPLAGGARTLPAWVISLARTPGRLERFYRDTRAAQEFPRLVVVAATDGDSLDVPRDVRISSVSRARMQRQTGRRAHSELFTRGMAGLYLSHVDAWNAFLASGEPVGVVFEDDAVVGEGTARAMDAAMRDMPPPGEWDLWLLGTIGVHRTRPAPPAFAPPSGGPPEWLAAEAWFGTQAYALTRRGARALVAHAFPMDSQVDAFLSQCAQTRELLVLTRARRDVDVPQFAWWVTWHSTVQQGLGLACDMCDLPSGFSRARFDSAWRVRGALVGVAAAVAAHGVAIARRRQLRARASGKVT